MPLRPLPTVTGIAIDDPKTRVYHQIASINDNILHYSVFCPPTDNRWDKEFLENMIDVLSDAKGLKTDKGQLLARNKYGMFMNRLKPTHQTGFVLNKEALALTYDFHFDKNRKIQAIDRRLTLATMTATMTCQEANEKIASKPPDPFLKTWHVLMDNQRVRRTKGMPFEHVINWTSQLIEKKNLDDSVQDNIGCLYRISYDGDKSRAERKVSNVKSHIFGSTLEYAQDFKKHGKDLYRARVPGTASREALHCINIASFAEHDKTGENLFSPQLLSTLAQYKTLTAA